jgi:hypothetical protein
MKAVGRVVAILAFLSSSVYADTLPIVADSYTQSNYPNTNYGAVVTATVRNTNAAVFQTWLRFNLAVLPSGTSIDRATLRLWVGAVGKPGALGDGTLPQGGAGGGGGGFVHLFAPSTPTITTALDVSGGVRGNNVATGTGSSTIGNGGGACAGGGGNGGQANVSTPVAGAAGYVLQTVAVNPENVLN